MANLDKKNYKADDPPELQAHTKINSHYTALSNKSLPPNTPKRYKSQQAQDTKSMIRRGGARGR